MSAVKERKSQRLLTAYRELRDAGASPLRRREAYNAYFRQSCKEGNPPDALRMHSADESERFWASTVPGPDGHVYWTGGRDFRKNDGRRASPQRWAWRASGRELTPTTELENTCGEKRCVNVDHIRSVPRSERRIRFSDEKAFAAAQVLALQLGRAPTWREWNAAGLPITASAVKNRFGSWGEFCRRAGLKPRLPHGTDAETCVRAIRALAAKLGRNPTSRDWVAHREWLAERGFPTSPTSIRNKLGGPFPIVVNDALMGRAA